MKCQYCKTNNKRKSPSCKACGAPFVKNYKINKAIPIQPSAPPRIISKKPSLIYRIFDGFRSCLVLWGLGGIVLFGILGTIEATWWSGVLFVIHMGLFLFGVSTLIIPEMCRKDSGHL